MDYKSAGVNTELASSLISSLKDNINQLNNRSAVGRVTTSVGGFAGSFQPGEAFAGMELVACTDGVGTKIQLAKEQSFYSGLGQDLVAMCVNDLYCMGAKPAFFLDYISCGKLNESWYRPVLESIMQACMQTGSALLGGETAEHPGVMPDDDFDLAGFCVGLRPQGFKFPREDIEAGDIVFALPSSGLHSNGFSLVRKLRAEKQNLKEFQDPDWVQKNLLAPTIIYKNIPELATLHTVKASVHVTGGGIPENLPRVLTNGLNYKIENWYPFPMDVYDFLQDHLELEPMKETFNMSMGMLIIGKEEALPAIKKFYPNVKVVGSIC